MIVEECVESVINYLNLQKKTNSKAMNTFISILYRFFTSSSRLIVARKNSVRKQIQVLNSKQSAEENKMEAAIVFGKIESLEQFKKANTILLYWSTKNEMPTHEFIEKWKDEKIILLPSVVGNDIVLKRYTKNLMQGLLGIWEPDTKLNFEGVLDLAIIPGVAFDRNRNRLGRGKGYYDRFLENYKCFKIGICFDFQLFEDLPANKYDKKMDLIISPNENVSKTILAQIAARSSSIVKCFSPFR
jgi:5-formyltetrahydrofolate cyclo-ligase